MIRLTFSILANIVEVNMVWVYDDNNSQLIIDLHAVWTVLMPITFILAICFCSLQCCLRNCFEPKCKYRFFMFCEFVVLALEALTFGFTLAVSRDKGNRIIDFSSFGDGLRTLIFISSIIFMAIDVIQIGCLCIYDKKQEIVRDMLEESPSNCQDNRVEDNTNKYTL